MTAPQKRLTLARSLPFWLLLPGLLVIAAIQLYPSLYTFYLGFQRIEPGTGQYVFRGLENFERLLTTRQFQESLVHTAIFLIGYATLTLGCALGIALLLRQRVKFNPIYITLIFIPWVLSEVIAGTVWRLFVVPEYGLLTPFFANPALFGPGGVSVLTSPAQPSIINNNDGTVSCTPAADSCLWTIQGLGCDEVQVITTSNTIVLTSYCDQPAFTVSVQVYDNGCLSEASEEAVVIIGVEEMHDAGFRFSIFPNPSHGVITLSGNAVRTDALIDVYNVVGDRVHAQKIMHTSNVQVDLSHLAQGVYVVRVMAEGKSEMRMMVIE